MHWNGYGWHMGGWMMIFWVVVILAIGVGVYFIAQMSRQANGPTDGPPSRETPEERLKRRYADGELNREEYLEKLEDLKR